MISLISFSQISDVLLPFACGSAIGNFCIICLGVRVLNCLWLKTLSEILASPFPCFLFGKIALSKVLRTFDLPLRRIIAFLRVFFFPFWTDSFGFADSLKISISAFNFICCSIASSNDKSLP